MKRRSISIAVIGILGVLGCAAGERQVRLTSVVGSIDSGEVVIDTGPSGATIALRDLAAKSGEESLRCLVRNRRNIDCAPDLLDHTVAEYQSCFEEGQPFGELELDSRLSTFAITSARPRHLVLNGFDPPGDVFFAGLMTCSNHEQAHLAKSFEKMQELSKDPPGCRRWRFVGAITNDGAMVEGLELGLQTFDVAALESLEDGDQMSDSVLFRAVTSPIWFPYNLVRDVGKAIRGNHDSTNEPARLNRS